MSVDQKEISRRFRLFCNIDPKMYEQLVRFVDARVDELTVAVTEAPPDQILIAQGRAQEARKFLRLMIEFPDENQGQQAPGNEPVIPVPGP
jgi:hypothetical protein